MARRIVITSGKGGVGKTTLAVQLAACLAKKGARVVVCDADFSMSGVDIFAGVENLVTYDIVDIVEGRCRAKQALVRHPEYPNLHLLVSRRASSERYLSPQAIKLVLDGLSPLFDFILIDCPSGVDEGFHRAVACAEEGIVVTTPHLSALRGADRAIALLKSYQLTSLSVVVNRVKGELLAGRECVSPDQIAELLKTPLLGVIPEGYDWKEGDLTNIHPSIRWIARSLTREKKRIYDPSGKYAGLAGNLRRVLKKRL